MTLGLIAVASPVGVASRALLVQWSQRVNSLVSAPGLQSAYAIVGHLRYTSRNLSQETQTMICICSVTQLC